MNRADEMEKEGATAQPASLRRRLYRTQKKVDCSNEAEKFSQRGSAADPRGIETVRRPDIPGKANTLLPSLASDRT